MKRFRLNGSFEDLNIITSIEEGGNIIATIPFLSDSNRWLYGIDNEIAALKKRGIFPTEIGFDLITLATMVYLADTRISRKLHAQDSWTREIELEIPVSSPKKWEKTTDIVERMLRFLTGDIWRIDFTERKAHFEENAIIKNSEYEKVSLFSGGMDSLISTINELEAGNNILLVSHAGDSITKNAQNNLINSFDTLYPERMHDRIGLWMVFNRDFIPYGGNENTTRSRSFLFISSAIFAMSGTENLKQLLVPENGIIALNVPLDNLRVGAHSTRTTHPFYLKLWNQLLKTVGFEMTVVNPYWNMTKGEMADQCKNKDILYKLMKISFSCSSPSKARWKGLKPQHCGYCVPCLIRRAAMYKAYGDDVTEYSEADVRRLIANRDSSEGIQIRSFQYAINRVRNNSSIAGLLIHKPGPLDKDPSCLKELENTYIRGLLEVDSFIEHELETTE